MKPLLGVLVFLLVAGCASIDGHTLVPGKASSADARALMGAPALTLAQPGGESLQYFERYRAGPAMYVARFGPDGILRSLEQRLVFRNIHAVRAGMGADEVRALLGPPFSVSRLPRQQRDVWEYPWRHAVRELRVLWVQFSDDGLVREAIEMHDHERDPENDFL